MPQQQVIRDFAKSRAKALKDIAARPPMRERAGMPRIKRKREAAPSLTTPPGVRTACGAPSPRDKNAARVMPVRAGLTPLVPIV